MNREREKENLFFLKGRRKGRQRESKIKKII
jgi:hypothetical protein